MSAATTTTFPGNILRLFVCCVCTWVAVACSSVDIGGPRVAKSNPAAGILELPSGQRLAVLPNELNYTGQATFIWPDGRQRSGQWLDGQTHGMATELYGNENYSGQWHRGTRHGHGELQLADGSRYVGDFENGLASGKGTWTHGGNTYQGTWRGGQRNGEGQFNGADGTVYQGQWQADQRQGYGRQQFASGGFYDGNWEADKPHGFGQFLFPTGATYEGSWLAGLRDGYGTWQSPANLSYEGTWQADRRNGFGRETRPDGSFYAGQWQHDEKHGEGREVHADGATHEGSWQHNRILGPGERTHATGIRISGNWQGDAITDGRITLPSGAVFSGALFAAPGGPASPELVAWLRDQAKNQDPHAQLFMAVLHQDFEQPEIDPATATVWLRRAAKAGVPDAQYRLALLLLDTERENALQWLSKAAAEAHAGANEAMGEYLHAGSFLPQDPTAAIRFYEVAADLGSMAATNNLAWLLATTADPNLADPERAIALIEPLVFYLGDWQHLDTLAAALARLGDFDTAQRMQTQALIQARSLATEAVISDMSARLDLYGAEQAYIE